MTIRKPRIAVVANTTWYLFNFRRRLMHDLRAAGYDPVAVGPEDKYAGLLRGEGIQHFDICFNGSRTNPLEELKAVLTLRRFFRKERIEAVLSYTPKANIYCALALTGLKPHLLINVSGLGRVFVTDGMVARLLGRLYQYAFSRASWVFFQNEDDRSSFVQKGLVRPSKTSRLPGSGVDLQRFVPESSPANTAAAKDESEVSFLLVARLLWDKGLGEYAAAARQIRSLYPSVKFHVLGSVEMEHAGAVPEKTLKQWVDEGVIDYLGTTDDVVPYLQSAHCVVLPSFYREGVPRSLLEAAAMAKPIITTDATGCRDTLDDGISGFLCRPRDSQNLMEKMLKFLTMSAPQRLEMGKAGREKMEREFDENIVISAYMAKLQELGILPTNAYRSLGSNNGRNRMTAPAKVTGPPV